MAGKVVNSSVVLLSKFVTSRQESASKTATSHMRKTLAPIAEAPDEEEESMAKANTLNSLANNLAHSYFSTLNYYDQGYLSDWVVNSTREISVDKMEVDILNRQINPKELEIKPFLIFLDGLNNTILKTLKSNNLGEDFIVEAKFIITVDHLNRIIKCDGFTKGLNGKKYSSKPYYEKSYEVFNALNPSTTEKVNRKAKSFIGTLRFYLWRKFNIGRLRFTKRLES